jgi:hypothetical protein
MGVHVRTPSASRRKLFVLVDGGQPMRIFAIVALALQLASCNGDRMKQGTNTRQAQQQNWWPLHTNDALYFGPSRAPTLDDLRAMSAP